IIFSPSEAPSSPAQSTDGSSWIRAPIGTQLEPPPSPSDLPAGARNVEQLLVDVKYNAWLIAPLWISLLRMKPVPACTSAPVPTPSVLESAPPPPAAGHTPPHDPFHSPDFLLAPQIDFTVPSSLL